MKGLKKEQIDINLLTCSVTREHCLSVNLFSTAGYKSNVIEKKPKNKKQQRQQIFLKEEHD